MRKSRRLARQTPEYLTSLPGGSQCNLLIASVHVQPSGLNQKKHKDCTIIDFLHIQEDMSLQSRLDIMCDEPDQEPELLIERDEGASHHGSSEKHIPELDIPLQSSGSRLLGTALFLLFTNRKYGSLQLPRGVFVPWLGSTYLCDYIQPSETIEVLKDHCVELISMEAPKDASTILEPEIESPMLIASISKAFWEMAGHLSVESNPDNSVSKNNEKARSQGTEQKAARSSDFNVVAAVLILIISIVVGLVLFVFRS